jgi:peptide deformylase
MRQLMAIRRILDIEIPADLAILRANCTPVAMTKPTLETLVADMIETMDAVDGVGLAAPQVGITQRLVVIRIPGHHEKRADGNVVEIEPEQLYVMLDPVITQHGESTITGSEGCLSLPGRYAPVKRFNWVTCEYRDLKGRNLRLRRATGLLARAVQHEIDHLNGVLFIDHVTDPSGIEDIRDTRR